MSLVINRMSIAKKLNNYEIYTGVADVYWIDTTHYRATVPTNKRWFLMGGIAMRENSATMTAYIYDIGNNIIDYLAFHVAGTGVAGYPLAAQTGARIFPFVMDAGEYLELLFGAAQSTAAYATCVVLEVNV